MVWSTPASTSLKSNEVSQGFSLPVAVGGQGAVLMVHRN